MSAKRILGLIAALAVLPMTTALAQPAVEAAPDTGFRPDAKGDLVHIASGTRFPAEAEGFVRAREVALDETGKNAAVVYTTTIAGEPSVARFALVQITDLTAHDHFISLAPIVGTYFRDLKFDDVKPISDGPLSLPGIAPRTAWQGHFSGTHDGKPYVLSLSTLDMGYWSARLTTAYPATEVAETQKRLNALAAIIRATGPAHTHAEP